MKPRVLPCFVLAVALSAFACGETTYVFDDVDVGDDQSGRAPQARSNAQFVRAAYADLIGRSTSTREITIRFGETEQILQIDEQRQLEAILSGLGDARALRSILIAGLVDHAEADIPAKEDVADVRGFVAEQFRRFLGREPSAYELEAFASDWDADAAVNPKTIIRALLGSREYQTI